MISQKCIWMECGYVEYKLCDRNFDCENCPFDKSIKAERGNRFISDSIKNKRDISEIKITPNHLWFYKNGNVFTFGLDNFAQKFFNSGCSIHLPLLNSRLFSGKTILWIIGSFGAIGFHSPVNGSVLWINESIKDNPSLFFEADPFSIELIKVESDDDKIEGKIYDFNDYKDLVYQDNLLAREFLLKRFTISGDGISTLPDGGDLKMDYLKTLSNQDFIQLLKLLFNKKI
ncbi:MAG: hypothetical protein HPY57_08425 [Ignavibacteria bacterium]|nr:hypothetical protein [Ignavibacteria bacterium]